MFETDMYSKDHPPWLCIANMKQLQYMDQKRAIPSSVVRTAAKKTYLEKDDRLLKFETQREAALFLGVYSSAITSAIKNSGYIKGWQILKDE